MLEAEATAKKFHEEVNQANTTTVSKSNYLTRKVKVNYIQVSSFLSISDFDRLKNGRSIS